MFYAKKCLLGLGLHILKEKENESAWFFSTPPTSAYMWIPDKFLQLFCHYIKKMFNIYSL